MEIALDIMDVIPYGRGEEIWNRVRRYALVVRIHKTSHNWSLEESRRCMGWSNYQLTTPPPGYKKGF